jgi:hypothetical protein
MTRDDGDVGDLLLNLFPPTCFSLERGLAASIKENPMKKYTAFLIAVLLTAVFAVANAKTRDLNPQPLPPGMKVRPQVQVNPQPLPPGATNPNFSHGIKVELNPQPLPPRALNPQPLPPGAK